MTERSMNYREWLMQCFHEKDCDELIGLLFLPHERKLLDNMLERYKRDGHRFRCRRGEGKMETDRLYYGDYKEQNVQEWNQDDKLRFIKDSVVELVDETRDYLKGHSEIQTDFRTMKIIVKEFTMRDLMSTPFDKEENEDDKTPVMMTVGLRFEKKEETET